MMVVAALFQILCLRREVVFVSFDRTCPSSYEWPGHDAPHASSCTGLTFVPYAYIHMQFTHPFNDSDLPGISIVSCGSRWARMECHDFMPQHTHGETQ